MTDLWHALHKTDLSYLRIVADQWGLTFSASDVRQGVDQLVERLLESDALLEVEKALSEGEREALTWLDREGGQAPWDQFSREFGPIRQMGAARMEREKPYLAPVSPGERLWYRALIARGFFETEAGPQEFAYLPGDIREIIMPLLNPERLLQSPPEFICRVAAPREREVEHPASRQLLDHLCSLLAAIRMDLDPGVHLPDVDPHQEAFYRVLVQLAGMVTAEGKVDPEVTRDFFELSRGQAVSAIWKNWKQSSAPGEVYLVPAFQVEGELDLDHQGIRENILAFLGSLEVGKWWGLGSFIAQIKERDPDFLRSGGEYDSWFIRRADSEDYLTGFQHWDAVEGELLRYFLTGPLHWLGLIDLGAGEEDGKMMAFRIDPLLESFASDEVPRMDTADPDPIQIRSQGEIRMTAAVPFKVRYQVARFCDWYPVKAEAYHYRISPDSLIRAENQGLRTAHLLSLLENHTEAIPPNVLSALQRWEGQGTQASIEHRVVMRVSSPEVLKSLQTSKASRYLVEQLGPTAMVIRPGSQEKVAQALMELGFFIRVEPQSGSQT